MNSIINYVSAKRRLKESHKTIVALGGEHECPPQIVAQNDMIRFEMEYYREEMVKFGWYCLCFTILCVILYTVYTMELLN
jgi:hypothetical protein